MTGQKGIIVKIKDSNCIVITPEGTYKKIPLPSTPVRVGAEIEIKTQKRRGYFRPSLFAAAVVLVAFCISIFNFAAIPQASAYVSVDINPSVELAVDKEFNVIDVEAYNKDGAVLVENLGLEDLKIEEALRVLLKEAVQQNYLTEEKEGLIIAAVSQSLSSFQQDITPQVNEALTQVIVETKIKASAKVYETDEDVHKLAKNQGLTTGKYLIYKQAKNDNKNVSVEDIKEKNIHKFTQEYKIKLLPNDKVIVKAKRKNTAKNAVELDQIVKQNQLKAKDKEHDKPNKKTTANGKDKDRNETNNLNDKSDSLGRKKLEYSSTIKHSNNLEEVKEEERENEEKKEKEKDIDIEEKEKNKDNKHDGDKKEKNNIKRDHGESDKKKNKLDKYLPPFFTKGNKNYWNHWIEDITL